MSYSQKKEETNNRVNNLTYELGDRFHEMFSYWICVISINGDMITTIEGHPSNALNMSIKTSTKENLSKRLRYTSLDDCWVVYCDTDIDKVNSYLQAHKDAIKKTNNISLMRELELNLLMG